MVLIESLVSDSVSSFSHLFVFSRFIHLIVLFIIFILAVNTGLVRLDVCDHIDVSSINVFQSAALGVDSDAHRFVNSSDFNTISRSDLIDHVFVSTQMDGLGCFAFRYTFRGFLNFHMLLVRESASVVHYFKRVLMVAHLAFCWLNDAAFL